MIVHPNTAASIAAGDERCCGFLYHKTFTPCEIDQTCEDGESFKVAGLTFTTHHLPGHTRSCTAFEIDWQGKKMIFSGDVIGTLGYGDFGWDGSIDFDKKVYLETLLKFSRMSLDVMLPGHGLVYFYQPKRRIESCLNEALMAWR